MYCMWHMWVMENARPSDSLDEAIHMLLSAEGSVCPCPADHPWAIRDPHLLAQTFSLAVFYWLTRPLQVLSTCRQIVSCEAAGWDWIKSRSKLSTRICICRVPTHSRRQSA